MVYEFWSLDIYNLIKDAATRGVRIRILLEGNVSGPSGDEYNRWMAYKLYNLSLQGYDITVRLDQDSYYLHAKVIIVDSEIVFVASENFVPTAYPPDPTRIRGIPYRTASRGWSAVMYNRTIASIFKNIFDQEFSAAINYDPEKHGYGKEPDDSGTIYYTAPFMNQYIHDPEASVQAIFSPENSTQVLLDAISNAKHFILMELLYIKNGSDSTQKLIQALEEARRRGVTVQIILEDDRPFNDDYSSIANNLTQLGFYVAPAFKSGSPPLFCHNKGIIIDDEYVIVGSINWSGTALDDNREAAVLIKSRAIARFYKEVFAWDWNQSSDSILFDSDGDGLSDAYETDHSLDTSNSDTDGDGLTDYEEVIIYSTDPRDPASPGIVLEYPVNHSYIPSTTVEVRWSASVNVTKYYLYLNNSLKATLPGSDTRFELTGLQDATWYCVRLIAELENGVNITYTVFFAIDITPPRISIIEPANNSYQLAGTLKIRWATTDFSSCQYFIYVNSSLVIETDTETAYLELSSGNYLITIKAKDRAGNLGENSILVYVREPPSIIITSPKNATYTPNTTIIVRWEIIGDYPVSEIGIFLNDTLQEYVNRPVSSYTVSLPEDGIYNITVACYDNAKFLNKASVFITRDTTPPKVEVLQPVNNSRLSPGRVSIKWKIYDKSPVVVTVKINGETKYIGNGTVYTTWLDEGKHTIEIIAKDAAGNVKSVKICLTVVKRSVVWEYVPLLIFLAIAVVLVILALKKLL